LALLGGCSSTNDKENTNAFYLTPLQTSSTKVSNVDLVSGAVTLNSSDIASKKQLSFTRVYSSNLNDSNQTLGNFTHNFNKQINPKIDLEKEPLASSLFATAKEACETGWGELAPKVLLGKLENAQAIYNATKEVCDIYENGNIKASMLIKNKDTQALASNSLKLLKNPNGTELLFFKNKEGLWENSTKSPIGFEETSEGYVLTLPNDSMETYNAEGYLTKISQAGQNLTLSYNGKQQLTTLTNSFGQSIKLVYDANTSLLLEVKSYDDTKVLYTYNEKNQLTTVTYPDNSTKSYSYDDKGKLTAIKDTSGTTVKTYTYNDESKVTDIASANGANAQTLSYSKENTTITQNGIESTYNFLIQHSLAKTASITDDEGTATYTYDANGYPLTSTSKLGVITQSTYNDRGLLVAQVNKAGSTSEEITLKSYHQTLHKPTKVVKAGVATFYEYNDNGQLTKKTQGSVSPSYKTISAKKMFAYTARSLKSTGDIQTKESSYEYNDLGLLSGTTQPNGAKTSSKYDAQGNPTENTNALGFTTKTTKFDKAGRALESIDINGKVSTTSYDNMGRVITSTVDGQTTTYEYDSNGRTTKTTYPDGLETYSKYDTSGNVKESGDNQGAKTLNTYDSNNNLIKTETYKDDVLTNKSQTEYDNKNRVIATIDSFDNKTLFTYNAKGQKTKTIDALGRVTTYEYDSLGQLIKETNPEQKTTEYTYNTKGQKTEVITPNKTAFTFDYDALQRVTSKSNPDRGETTYTYDISDNIATETNAKGETKTYTYDLANRKTSTSYDDASLNETYEYDQGENAKGKLTKISDASGSLEFSYDAKGNLATKTQTIDNKTFTTTYTYNSQDKLITQTYPSGKTLSYDYNAQGELNSISIDGSPYITDIKTNQNGLVSYTYADSSTHTREYDTNGRVTKLIYPNYTEEVNYNKVSNITSITADSKTKTYNYDLIDRLTSYDSNATDYQRFTYDANGNRLILRGLTSDNNASALLSVGLTPVENYTYTDNTNTLTGIKYYHTIDENTTNITKDINYTYDATGNIVDDGTHTYTYDSRNRLVSVDSNITYQYNYDNKRVSKTVNGITTYYIYEAHKLIGEYDQDANPIKEYIYFNDTPLATTTATETYKIYADHLDTPRRVADNANNIVWSWESSPFGETTPTGTLSFNLRFLGQYFDVETRTHYNINRDYNPVTGRYVQSDPIGFDGGVNGYLYANGNSVINVDKEGLIIGSVLKAAKECIKNPKKCKKSFCNTLNSGMHSVCDTVRSCKGTETMLI
jgi:RHS repeat-associated protein